jgi:NADPH2:quinone reductase
MLKTEVTRFGGPEVLSVTEAPDPRASQGEILIDVLAIEVLFLDTQLRSGWAREFFPFEPPFVPGTGVAGTVSSAGQGISWDWVGQLVVARTGPTGAYAERVAVPAEQAFVIPQGVSSTEALAALHDGPTALSRLEQAAIRPREKVFVGAAAGSLGVWLVPLASAAEAFVIAAAGGKRKLEHARAMGADTVIDYSEAGWPEQLRQATSDAGLDVVFDGTGGKIGQAAFTLMATGGRFFSYGAASGAFAEIDPEMAKSRQINVVGIEDTQLSAAQLNRLVDKALSHIAQRTIHPSVGQVVAFERAPEAHAAIEARQVIGKTVLLTAEGRELDAH